MNWRRGLLLAAINLAVAIPLVVSLELRDAAYVRDYYVPPKPVEASAAPPKARDATQIPPLSCGNKSKDCCWATGEPAPEGAGELPSLLWPVMVAVLWFYARHRCSSDRMLFSDGLLWVTASMMTGWLYFSFFFVLPVLFIVFSGAVLIALYGDIRRAPGYSQARYQRLVYCFYRNRMRQ